MLLPQHLRLKSAQEGTIKKKKKKGVSLCIDEDDRHFEHKLSSDSSAFPLNKIANQAPTIAKILLQSVHLSGHGHRV